MPLGIDLTQILLHMFNVVLLFTGLYVILYSPVKKIMKQREEHYKEMDEAAKKNLAEAEEKNAKEVVAPISPAEKSITGYWYYEIKCRSRG